MEKWTTINAIAATLAYLYYCGYMLYADGAFQISAAGENSLNSRMVAESGILRPYEIDMLKAVAKNDLAGITTALWFYNFEPLLAGLDLYQVKITRGRLFDKRQMVATNNFAVAVARAIIEREAIGTIWDRRHELDARARMDAYAFPSLMSKGAYLQIIEKAVESIRHPQGLAEIMAIAAMIHVVSTMVKNEPQMAAQVKSKTAVIV